MNLQWESLIRAVVPLSFMAIWAVTSLLNRDNKPKFAPPRPSVLPPRPSGGGVAGVRPGEPTLRWGSPAGTGPVVRPAPARRPTRPDDDGIVILASDTRRPERDAMGRPIISPSGKRPSKGKPVVPPRPAEATSNRGKLAGVSQNVNQHLTAATLDMPPMTALPTLANSPTSGPAARGRSGESNPTQAARSAARALTDPARLREAFILNEILQPPVALRPQMGGMARR